MPICLYKVMYIYDVYLLYKCNICIYISDAYAYSVTYF